MNAHLRVVTLVVPALLSGCGGVDRDGGKALGTAGESATQAIFDQTNNARVTIDALPQWHAVHDALVCANVTAKAAQDTCLKNVRTAAHWPPPNSQLGTDLQTLSDVMSKRATAVGALRDAYKAFVDLATYDAGAETAQAIQKAFSSLNSLSAAAAPLGAPGAALSVITPTFTTAVSGTGAFIADERQAHEILLASKDLHTAVDALSKALLVERDKAASESLFATLQDEQDQLYASMVQAGLVTPAAALKPLASQVAPGTELVSNPPAQNAEVIRTATTLSLTAQSRIRQRDVARSYDSALATLSKLADQHAKLEQGQPLNLSSIESEAAHLKTILDALNK